MCDDTFYLTAFTSSTDGDVSNYIGGIDIWLMKLDSMGNTLWDHFSGGIHYEACSGGIYTPDNKIILFGVLFEH